VRGRRKATSANQPPRSIDRKGKNPPRESKEGSQPRSNRAILQKDSKSSKGTGVENWAERKVTEKEKKGERENHQKSEAKPSPAT